MRTLIPTVAALVVVVGLAAIVYGVVTRGKRVDQPIAFNHVVHLEDAGMQCIECHKRAETSVHAGLPGKNICLDCHDIDDEEGSHLEKDKLFGFDDVDEDIPWRRVAVTAPDVFFSHRRHVTSGKIDCLTCHRDQPTLSVPPPTARLVMPMTECIACHRQRNTTEDCLACHR